MKRTLILWLLLATGAIAQSWSFTVTATALEDAYCSQLSPNTNFGNLDALWIGQSYGDRWFYIGAATISDSLAKYGGQVTSVRLVDFVHNLDGDFTSIDSLSITWNALKVDPVELEVTDNIYATGLSWQVRGANGDNDQYTPRESDGVHADSVILRSTAVAGDSIVLYGNPDHAGAEFYVVRGTHLGAGEARAVLCASEHQVYDSYKTPYFVFEGESGTGGSGAYKKVGSGVRLGSGVKM